jgi:hypothetical protein
MRNGTPRTSVTHRKGPNLTRWTRTDIRRQNAKPKTNLSTHHGFLRNQPLTHTRSPRTLIGTYRRSAQPRRRLIPSCPSDEPLLRARRVRPVLETYREQNDMNKRTRARGLRGAYQTGKSWHRYLRRCRSAFASEPTQPVVPLTHYNIPKFSQNQKNSARHTARKEKTH